MGGPRARDAARFCIAKIDFALSRSHNPAVATYVWVSRSNEQTDAAIELLLNALGLGLGPEAITYRWNSDTGFDGQRA